MSAKFYFIAVELPGQGDLKDECLVESKVDAGLEVQWSIHWAL